MLQQTQVTRVLERYPRWLMRFPSFEILALARQSDVLEEWQGMGYNRRALWLQKIAVSVVNDYDGVLPASPSQLQKLTGIGPNTAGSIAAFAFNSPVTFIETNIRRVFINAFFSDEMSVEDKQLLPIISACVSLDEPREWYYALMDYGSYLVKQMPNPNRRSKQYTIQSVFEGSLRQLRGEVLRRLLSGLELPLADSRLPVVLAQLEKEGFLREGKIIP
jgi:A/G-specific adenine glycosylase